MYPLAMLRNGIAAARSWSASYISIEIFYLNRDETNKSKIAA